MHVALARTAASIRILLTSLVVFLAMFASALRAQTPSPGSLTKAAANSHEAAAPSANLLERLKATAQASPDFTPQLQSGPIGNGLNAADPFFGGTTDSIILYSVSPLVIDSPLLRRLPDCTIEAGIGSSSTFQVSQRIQKYEDRLHQVARLTTAPDLFPHGCTDPVTGVPSQPGAVFGHASDGNFYAVVAIPSTTNFRLTNQLTIVHTVGNPISSQPAVTSTVTLNPNASVVLQGDLAVGDLNGDGQLDVVALLTDNSSSGSGSANNSLAILLNAGNGALGSPSYIPLNVIPVSLLITDVNGDGKLDIVVLGEPTAAGGTQGMEVFLGNGDGTFKAPVMGPANFPSVDKNGLLPTNSAVHVIARDFNGDKKIDLIASTGDILFGNGDGTFTVAPTTLPIPGNAGRGIASADFNHDGKADLAVSVFPGTIYTFFGKGDGSFTLGNVYASATGTTDLTATDIDGDGNYDIVVGVCSGGLYLPDGLFTLSGYFLLGRSDGTFAGPLSYQPTLNAYDNVDFAAHTGIQVGDVMGDGKQDIVSIANTTLAMAVETRPYNGVVDGDLSYGSPITSTGFTIPAHAGLKLADVTGDGKLDLVYMGSIPARIVTLPGKGDGTFGPEVDTALPGNALNAAHAFVIGDFNGDAKPDIVEFSYNSANTLVLQFGAGNSTGAFGTLTPIDSSLITPSDLIAADFNGDGKLDLALVDVGNTTTGPVIKIYLGHGDGTFAAPSTLPISIDSFMVTNFGSYPFTLAMGDLRKTGKLDLIAVGSEFVPTGVGTEYTEQGFYEVYFSNGNGTFAAQTPVTPAISPIGGQDVALADFSRHGNLDLLASCGFTLCLFPGNGDGTFGTFTFILVPGSVSSFVVADVNGDGFPDLLCNGGGIIPALNVPAIPLLSTTAGTTTALQASTLQAAPGANITFTATVTPASGTAVPTGTVEFFDSSNLLVTQALNSSGVATYRTTALALGAHSINALYSGDANFTISSSAAVTVTISNAPAPIASLSVTSLTFASQTVNTSSASQNVTLSNTGSGALNITGITITGANSGDFSQTNTCGSSVAASANCTISVTFKPTTTGSRSASVSIADNASGSPQAVSLTGTGAAATPTASLSVTSLTFASQTVNTSSASQNVTLSNTGSGALNITGITITGANSGDFSQTNTCGSSVAASANCTISVTFKPTATGSRSASVSIADNASGSPQAVSLMGTGAAATPTASLSVTSLTFTSQTVNTSSAAQNVTLSNTGSAALNITGITITGANSGDFSQTNTCGSSVAASANCAISVTFKPTATGSRSASVSIADNASGSPQAIVLSGAGTTAPTASLSPATTTFPDELVTTASPSQALTFRNTSGSAISVSGISFTGANASDFSETDNCGTTVVANSSCTINVVFKPGASGARSATLSVADNVTGSPQTAALSGNGFDFAPTAAPSGSTTATVNAGSIATYALQVSAVGGAASDKVNFTVACIGAPRKATCTGPIGTLVVSPGSPNLFTVSVATGPAPRSTIIVAPDLPFSTISRLASAALLLLLLVVLLLVHRKFAEPNFLSALAPLRWRFLRPAPIALLFLAALFAASCNGGSSNNVAPGTYQLTVTVTSGANSHPLPLTLIVK